VAGRSPRQAAVADGGAQRFEPCLLLGREADGLVDAVERAHRLVLDPRDADLAFGFGGVGAAHKPRRQARAGCAVIGRVGLRCKGRRRRGHRAQDIARPMRPELPAVFLRPERVADHVLECVRRTDRPEHGGACCSRGGTAR
jgi:hypothetical protein